MTGTPERPLSDMGNVAYRSYWQSALLEFFKRPSTSYTVLTLEGLENLCILETFLVFFLKKLHEKRVEFEIKNAILAVLDTRMLYFNLLHF